jgi:glutamine amidotransferase
MPTFVAIVDYGMCNLDSVRRAVEECGSTAVITRDPHVVEQADRIILPGVGAFGEAIHNLRAASLDTAMTEQVIGKQIPFLGICLGMQLMAKSSTENGHFDGLGWIDAEVHRLIPQQHERIPHIGWNDIQIQRPSRLLTAINSGSNFYFVHSYHVKCSQPQDVAATTAYADGFVSAIEHEWLFGVQFHPEKSQKLGLQVLRNFLNI